MSDTDYLNAFFMYLSQVFVNFARQQHDAEDGVYDNPVDLSDEIPMHTHTHTE